MWRAFRIPYVVSTQRGVFHKDLKAFHTTYGPVVRIAPNELSYADSRAWKDVYQTRPGQPLFERNRIWLQKPTPDAPSSIMSYDEDDHARFRRAFSNSFSEKSYKEQLPVVENYIDLLIQQLKVRKTADLAKWFNYLSFDLTGDLSFGESFDCLKNGEAHPWVEIGTRIAKMIDVRMY
jgi:cytochrome P450